MRRSRHLLLIGKRHWADFGIEFAREEGIPGLKSKLRGITVTNIQLLESVFGGTVVAFLGELGDGRGR